MPGTFTVTVTGRYADESELRQVRTQAEDTAKAWKGGGLVCDPVWHYTSDTGDDVVNASPLASVPDA